MGNSCKKCFQKRAQKIYPTARPRIRHPGDTHRFTHLENQHYLPNSASIGFRNLGNRN